MKKVNCMSEKSNSKTNSKKNAKSNYNNKNGSGEQKNKAILIQTLKEIFQFDKIDLDFGIYRILNIKKKEIDKFIEKDLFEIISKEIKTVDNTHNLQKTLDVLKDEIEKTFSYGIDEALTKNTNAPKIQEYLKIEEEINQNQNLLESQEDLFDHLINFFSRYYDNGDIISKRRYSKENQYAIPYNGEEIYLYWANHDQYYIKTAENFTNYSFKADDWTINFEITGEDVDLESVNIKDPEKKYFIYYDLKSTGRTLTIYFGYRGLTGEEEEKVKKVVNKKNITQDYVNAYNLKYIKENMLFSPITELKDKHRKLDGKLSEVTEIEWHLTKYTTKNTVDYFIHKDLKGFLSRELDFYIKNEIFDIDNLADNEDLTLSFKKIRIFKAISIKIIEFLSQFEEFQKKLWEKKKFVLSTEYLITLDYIDEKYYPEILKNVKQINEWKNLNLIDLGEDIAKKTQKTTDNYQKSKKEIDIDLLKANPTLMIDTKFFENDFKWNLLCNFKNLEENLNGILIQSDNFHALNLLLSKYNNRVKTCYIDPPYNTDNKEFLYKDNFKHGSWLSMMKDRLMIIREFLKGNGNIFVSIDNNEIFRLFQLMCIVFGEENFVENFLWTKTSTAPSLSKKSRKTTEYVLCFEKNISNDQYKGELNSGEDAPLINNINAERTLKFPKEIIKCNLPNGLYKAGSYENAKLMNDAIVENGIIKNEISLNFKSKWVQEYLDEEIKNGTYFIIKSDKFSIRYIRDNSDSYKAPTNQIKNKFLTPKLSKEQKIGTNESSNKEIKNLGFDFDYPKPVSLVKHLINLNTDKDDIILDCFAGSGTTGCAVLQNNKEKHEKKKFFLIEMGQYFNTLLKPRLVKFIFSENWKEKRPQDNKGSLKQIIKYQYLEQYEDSLHNIEFEIPNTLPYKSKDYQLKYMLDFESKDNPIFLDIDMLDNPFDYELKIKTEKEFKIQKVDLVETFNYIAGIFVDSISQMKNGNIDYIVVRGYRDEKDVIVIWRNKPKSFDPKDDKEFVENEILRDDKFDEILVNGNSLITKAISLDEIFKKGMFGWE